MDKDVRIIFNWGADTSAPLIPVAEKDCFPLSVLTSSQKVMSKNNKCVIGFTNSGLDFGKTLARYLARQNFKKIGIVHTENDYMNALIEGIKLELNSDILTIAAAVQPNEMDFRSLVSGLKNKDFDALGIFLFPAQAVTFYKRMQEQRFSLYTFGTDVFESREVVENSGLLIQNAVYPHVNVDPVFMKRYRERFNSDSQVSHAGSAYDFALLVGKLFGNKDNKVFTNTEIIEKFKTTEPQTGVMGDYYFSDSPEDGARFRFPVHVKRVKGNDFEIVDE